MKCQTEWKCRPEMRNSPSPSTSTFAHAPFRPPKDNNDMCQVVMVMEPLLNEDLRISCHTTNQYRVSSIDNDGALTK
jgi:hypothetical protein